MDFNNALNLFQRTLATGYHGHLNRGVLAPTEITHLVNVGWDVAQGMLCL